MTQAVVLRTERWREGPLSASLLFRYYGAKFNRDHDDPDRTELPLRVGDIEVFCRITLEAQRDGAISATVHMRQRLGDKSTTKTLTLSHELFAAYVGSVLSRERELPAGFGPFPEIEKLRVRDFTAWIWFIVLAVAAIGLYRCFGQ